MKKVLALLSFVFLVMAVSCSGCNGGQVVIPSSDTVTVTNIHWVQKTKVVTNFVDVLVDKETGKVTTIEPNKDNLISLGGSICGRAFISYDRMDIINFGKIGFGLGIYSTMNIAEPNRFWDFGAKINFNF